MTWQEIVIKVAIGLACTLATGLGSWLLVKVKTFISTKIKNTKLATVLTTATDIVTSAVKSTYQTYVQGIKGTEAWTIDAQKTALSNAINVAKEQMPKSVKKAIESNFGNIDKWVETQIESTLYALKNSNSK